jgi:RimJ/RimL family protein N-acetyltransferase
MARAGRREPWLNGPASDTSSQSAIAKAQTMTGDRVIHPNSGLPIGPEVDSAPAPRPRRTTLRGRLVTVTALDPKTHEEALYEGTHGPDKERLWLYLGEGPFPDRASFRAYLENRAISDDPLSFAIVSNVTGRAAGHASYMRISPEHRVIEVGNIFYTPALAHSSGGTEAMYLMARHVFEDLGYRRYEWKCNAFNEPSRRAALRFGFSFEGIFRQHMIQKGRSRDTAWYSMLDHDWPSRKAQFERWLSPDNFDESGDQRVRLSSIPLSSSRK